MDLTFIDGVAILIISQENLQEMISRITFKTDKIGLWIIPIKTKYHLAPPDSPSDTIKIGN